MSFSYFGLRIYFKARNVVIAMSQWTFNINLAQHTTFEGN